MLNILQQRDWNVPENFHANGDSIGIFIFFALFMMLFGFLINFLIAYLVYNDARKKGDQNAVLWFIIVFFSTILGVILYLILSNSKKTPSPYYRSAREFQGQTRYQASHGTATVGRQINYCKNCGSKLDSDGRFCQDCGFEVRRSS